VSESTARIETELLEWHFTERMNVFVCGSDKPVKILAVIDHNWRWLVIRQVFDNAILAIVGVIIVGSIVNTVVPYTVGLTLFLLLQLPWPGQGCSSTGLLFDKLLYLLRLSPWTAFVTIFIVAGYGFQLWFNVLGW